MSARAALLQDYLADQAMRTLRPGQHDCALFAAGWVERLTGRDPAAAWRGRYRTFAQGRALLAAEGLGDHVDLASRDLTGVAGWMQARPGDIAVIEEAGAPAFGIVGGRFIHVLAPRGLDVVPLARAVRVFRP